VSETKPFKVGDKVFVVRSGAGGFSYEERSIAKVFKQYVEDEKGRKWNLDGKERGERNHWSFANIEHAEPQHYEELAKQEEKSRRWTTANRIEEVLKGRKIPSSAMQEALQILVNAKEEPTP
jgi:hypothetical protein